MPILDNRIDINKKYPVSSSVKMIILLAAIFGFTLRGCWIKSQKKNIVFSNVKISGFSSANIDVEFDVTNKINAEYKKAVLIKVMSKNGVEIASKITKIYVRPLQKKRGYLVELTKIKTPIKSIDEVGFVSVKLYNPSIFN